MAVLGTMRRFIVIVARQVAKQCEEEFRLRQKQAANPRTQLPAGVRAGRNMRTDFSDYSAFSLKTVQSEAD
jgi:hypothetical protein